MGLADYQKEMETCCRCSACKFIPLENVVGQDRSYSCPSISRYNFHSYSGAGRLGMGIALLDKEIDFSDKLAEIVYNCQMCGACDVSCKYAMDMEVFEPISEMRIACVEHGTTLPVLDKMVEGLRKTGRLVPSDTRKGTWFDGLTVKDYTKEKVDVVYHAGCRTNADPSLWNVARSTVRLMQKAGVDVGIAAEGESCCGGRVYYMGYKDDFLKQAEQTMQQIAKSGTKLLVTSCAEGYQAFKVLYDRFKLLGDIEVMHTSQYFLKLIKEGKLKPSRNVNMNVTYHDPCYLGRLGEPWIHWEGKRIPGQMILFDPPKEYRRGTNGVYAAPRDLLAAIPGVTLTEMVRTREFAWCCGAGGGVKRSNPEFAEWTAKERLSEAGETGAEALVTACPGCERNFADAQKSGGEVIPVYDIVEILAKAIL